MSDITQVENDYLRERVARLRVFMLILWIAVVLIFVAWAMANARANRARNGLVIADAVNAAQQATIDTLASTVQSQSGDIGLLQDDLAVAKSKLIAQKPCRPCARRTRPAATDAWTVRAFSEWRLCELPSRESALAGLR